MRYVDADLVHRLLPYQRLIPWLEKKLTGEIPISEVVLTNEPDGGPNKFVTLVGWQAGELIAVKMVGVFPGNLQLQPPQASVQGLVCVFCGQTGAPQLVADGEAMTFRKTAADSGLGSRLLAREDARILLVVGAGGLGPHVAAAHRAARPSINKVLVWNRTFERAQSLAARLRDKEGVTAEAMRDLDEAVPQADIISCVTMSTQPLVKGALLKPGTHLDLVGSYLPEMCECDTDAIARGSVFVNSRSGITNAGDLVQAFEAGRFRWEDIRADASELCTGIRSGRTFEDEITIYKNIGGAQFDLFTAELLMQETGGDVSDRSHRKISDL
ncbi:ornithine cyclodeaminase [Labrys sp. WJW]|uniref:ornithine cyclodeaminase n=1 Tax=Labrys sp. WJW TaxID=1737983 RepID=UPI0008326164|nr:ornithine cyclodeaminase [Labrys sp. WJW]OCC05368.1 ornithine cyclodeaminase [Labrys sp. WJW]